MTRWVGRTVALVLAAALVAGGVLALVSLRNERDYDRLVEAGDVSMSAADLSGAVEAYTGAITLKSDAMAAYLKRGLAYRQRGEPEAALRDLRRAAELDPTAPRVFEWLGDVNLTLTRYSRAADSFDQSLALDDRQAGVLYKLAVARYREGRPATAIDPLRRAVALAPELVEAHYLLGVSLRDAGRNDDALLALATAIRLAPGMLAAREARADILRAQGRGSRSLDDLEALVALEPDKPGRAVALGVAQARAGRRDAAVVGLARAAERFPEAVGVFAALGQVWLNAADMGDEVALAKAIAVLSQAVTLPDAGADVRALLGRARLRAGDLNGAERDLRLATERLPVPPYAYVALAEVLERRQRWEDARDALLRFAALTSGTPDTSGVATRIGALSMRLGDPHSAAYWYEKAVAQNGPSADLLQHQAEAEASRGAVGRARELVVQGLALEPRHAGLRALQRTLTPSGRP